MRTMRVLFLASLGVLLPLLTGCGLQGCQMQQPEFVNWRGQNHTEIARCQIIAGQASLHDNACSVDFWNEYKACYGGFGTQTGCLVLIGTEAPPECYRVNCPDGNNLLPPPAHDL